MYTGKTKRPISFDPLNLWEEFIDGVRLSQLLPGGLFNELER